MCTELKKATYANDAEVVYLIIGDNCFFTGTTRPSTINAAEEVIQSISEQERVVLGKLCFFDLQTHLMYHRHPSGYFELDMVYFNTDGRVISNICWIPFICPDEIFTAFREYIGEPPIVDAGMEAYLTMLDEQAEEELASEQYPVLTPERAMEQDFMFTPLGSSRPSGLLKHMDDDGTPRVIVDNGDDRVLFRQSGGHRFSLWIKR